MTKRAEVKIMAHTPEPEKIIAMAAKLCYSKVGVEQLEENLTEEKINKFIEHLISIGHESPLEHITFSFAIEGISRACSHQIVRHRLASFSQQSQRYVDMKNADYIIPPRIAQNPELKEEYINFMDYCFYEYLDMTNCLISEILEEQYSDKYKECLNELLPNNYKSAEILFSEKYPAIYNKVEKIAMEDARYMLPNACETKMVMTMNLRELLHFFKVRRCNRAQWEIRDVADRMFELCKEVSPLLFNNAGPSCIKGKCTEGSMSCGKPRKE